MGIRMKLSNYLKGMTRKGPRIITKQISIIQAVYLVVVILFMAGIVNAIFFPVSNQAFIIYPQPGAQSIPETFVDIFVIGLGGLGVYVSYIAGRQTTRPRLVNIYLLLSLLLLFLSLIVGIYVFATK
jgi:hypothetical protein